MNYSVRTDEDTLSERARIAAQRTAFDTGIFQRAWMVIPGTDGRYEVSGAGLVRHCGTHEPRKEGEFVLIHVADPRLLSPGQRWQGPKKYGVQARRLVAAAFYGLPQGVGWHAVVLEERTMDSAWDTVTGTWPDEIELQTDTARARRWARYVTNIRWAFDPVPERRIIGVLPGPSPRHFVVGEGVRYCLTAVGSWSNTFPGRPLEVDNVESYFDSYGQTSLDEQITALYNSKCSNWYGPFLELGERAASFSSAVASGGAA